MCIARDYYFKMTFSSFIIFNHMYVYCELERIFFENKIFCFPEKSKRLYFKMTFFFFIIINHMYEGCLISTRV